MPAAPARLKASRLSIITASPSSQPGRGRGLQHRVLARHLVGERRHAERLGDAAHDVEIRHARLDHDHVGALGEIERDLAQRFVGVGGVHLVGALVAAGPARTRASPKSRRHRGTGRRTREAYLAAYAMISVLVWPFASSAVRMAPTRPSIMSEGARMSAPASACTSDWRTSASQRLVVGDLGAAHADRRGRGSCRDRARRRG